MTGIKEDEIKEVQDPLLPKDEYADRLNAELGELVAFCAEHWGDAPELSATVEDALLVKCDFDLGISHTRERRHGSTLETSAGEALRPSRVP